MDGALLRRWCLAWLAVGALGCSFYAPELGDCTLKCSASAECPENMTCRGGVCRSGTSTAGCGCVPGDTQTCGTNVGECRVGTQTCRAGGVWSECTGGVGPSAEVCDGKDNDCDGLIDLGPVVELASDLSSTWRLHGWDAGYALVHTRAAGGAEELVVTWLNRSLSPLATSAPLRSGPTADAVTASVGSTIFAAFATEDGGLSVLSATPAGSQTPFEPVPQAGRPLKLHLGASQLLVANWMTTATSTASPHPRLARWNLDGTLQQVVDLDVVDGGRLGVSPYGCNLSVQGHYSIYLADPSAATQRRIVQDTRTLEVLRTDAPYFGESFAKVIEQPSGAISSTYTYANVGQTWSGVYFNPDLLGTVAEKVLAESHADSTVWGDSDATLDADGHIAIVYMDRAAGRLVLARSVGGGALAANPNTVTLEPGSGYGSPRLAQSGNDAMLGLAWATGAHISARRVCGAK